MYFIMTQGILFMILIKLQHYSIEVTRKCVFSFGFSELFLVLIYYYNY